VKPKPVVLRELAKRDIDETLGCYLSQGAKRAALGVIDALEAAFVRLGRHPGSGSPRYAHELNLPGLRAWPLKQFPYVVFYVEHLDHLDVWRVLHGQRDIPVWMQQPDGY